MAVALSNTAHGATHTVANTNDNGADSLRQAIENAASGDTISFSVTGVITLTTGQLLITNDLTILGPGATNLAISGNHASRIFDIASNVTSTISGITIRDGQPGDTVNGGGIHNSGMLMLIACTVIGNGAGTDSGGSGGHGGGIYNAGVLILNASTLSANSAGGGLPGASCSSQFCLAGSGGNGGHGGGIFNVGSLTVTSCTFMGNTSGAGGYGGSGYSPGKGGDGGNGGAICNAGTLSLTACTLSGNSTGGGGVGGFGYIRGPDGCAGSGGGIYNASAANLRSVILALNSPFGFPAVCFGPPPSGKDLAGSFTSSGYNLIGQTDGSSGFTNGLKGDLTGTTASPLNPRIGPLQDNGGPTFTMAILPGSPALEHGDDALIAPPFDLSTDQRGLPRMSGDHVDIGAVELQLPLLTQVSQSGTDVIIRFTTEVARIYRLERTHRLGTTSWPIVEGNIVGNGGTKEALDAGATAAFEQRFYRVVMLSEN